MTDGDAEINPVITLTVRAYDDGIPSLDAEVPVHIFTEDVSSRMMRFIVSQDPESVEENQDQVTIWISYNDFGTNYNTESKIIGKTIKI